MNAYQAYALVGGISAAASLLLGCIALKTFTTLSDSGIWAIAVMTFAPALLGIGVSLFICLSHRSAPPRERRLPPEEPLEPGAFTSSHR
jgi:hypothetical protein